MRGAPQQVFDAYLCQLLARINFQGVKNLFSKI